MSMRNIAIIAHVDHGKTSLTAASDNANWWRVFLLALIAVAREGSETVVFLSGTIEEIDGRPFGNLTVELPAADLGRVRDFLHAQDLRTEVLGHVG